jgi:putative cardiolipin synthase
MSSLLPLASHTEIASGIQQQLAKYPAGESLVSPLSDGLDAFAARMALILSASSAIDLQYYIYRDDETGRLLTAALLDAADRGVRVRMLVDDMPNSGDDGARLLDAHPNIEVRLFNPFMNRRFKLLEIAGSFERINRRMHNKSLTADGLMTVVGGRNIGDEYFDAHQSISFGDLDLLAIGPVVAEVGGQFDEYWNSPFAINASTLLGPADLSEQQRQQLIHHFYQSINQASPYIERLKHAKLIEKLSSGELNTYHGPAITVYDPITKMTAENGAKHSFLSKQMASYFDQLSQQLLIISPYFIPGDEIVASLNNMVARGIDVTVITNSLAATDVVAVHSGYEQYRRPLLQGGVKLYEVKVDPTDKPGTWKGSSRASLHAKSFVLDERFVYVGSLNLDPRSVIHNTEMGLLIASEELAAEYNKTLENIATSAYRLALEDEQLVWHDDQRQLRFKQEPDASIWRRAGAWLIGWLPIESLL